MNDDEIDNGKESQLPEEFMEQLNQVVNNQFAKKEREDARDLIQSSFKLLPLELQELYYDIMQLYREGKHEEASDLFEHWLDEARDLGLI